MRIRDLTAADVLDFYSMMAAKHAFVVEFKGDSPIMTFAADMLEAFGLIERSTFMTEYATTLGNRIYLPYVPGNEESNWSLQEQIYILCHEATHVLQFQAAEIKFAWMYVLSPEERATYEAQAYRAEIAPQWRYEDIKFDTDYYSGALKSYGCSDAQVAMAKALMDTQAEIVYAGGIVEETAKECIEWMKAKGIL